MLQLSPAEAGDGFDSVLARLNLKNFSRTFLWAFPKHSGSGLLNSIPVDTILFPP
jgi:hypothetical protein